jgi:hypothetical protein
MSDPAPDKSTEPIKGSAPTMEEIQAAIRMIIAADDRGRQKAAEWFDKVTKNAEPVAEQLLPNLQSMWMSESSVAVPMTGRVSVIALLFLVAISLIAGGIFVIGFDQFMQLRLIFGGVLIGAAIQVCAICLRSAREKAERDRAERERKALYDKVVRASAHTAASRLKDLFL